MPEKMLRFSPSTFHPLTPGERKENKKIRYSRLQKSEALIRPCSGER
jgi:hypothetical protein